MYYKKSNDFLRRSSLFALNKKYLYLQTVILGLDLPVILGLDPGIS